MSLVAEMKRAVVVWQCQGGRQRERAKQRRPNRGLQSKEWRVGRGLLRLAVYGGRRKVGSAWWLAAGHR